MKRRERTERENGSGLRTAMAVLLLALSVPGVAIAGHLAEMTMGDEQLILKEDFSRYDGDAVDGRIEAAHEWWVEGGERAWVEEGRLHIKSDPEAEGDSRFVATVWCKTPISGDVRVELKAHVLNSSVGANNINVFLFYSNPSGKPLFESREERADAAYNHYHDLNGYIVTFLRDRHQEAGLTADGHPHARLRLRRCPGFELVNETYDPIGVETGETYHLTITRRGGIIAFAVDGKEYLRWEDEDPLKEGLLGLRTFRTDLWWDDIRVHRLTE